MDIRLTDSLVYITKDTKFDPSVFVKEVEYSYTEELVPKEDWGMDIQSTVDTSKAGVYEVRYMIKKEQDAVYGSVSGVTWLTVIVAD